MIQRIQTVFLFLAAVAFAVKLWLPVATTPDDFGAVMADGTFQTTDDLWLTIFALVGVIISFFNIFLYRRRKSQMRFCMTANLFAIIWAALGFYTVLELEVRADGAAQIAHGWAFIFALLAIVFNTLAYYFIKKDEKLVRSMNSLR